MPSKKKAPGGRPPFRPTGGRPAHLVEDGEETIHALMVTVDADGYQEVRPRNGAPATLGNFGARKAGLTQRERKAQGACLQNMFSLLDTPDTPHIRYVMTVIVSDIIPRELQRPPLHRPLRRPGSCRPNRTLILYLFYLLLIGQNLSVLAMGGLEVAKVLKMLQ